MSTARGRGRYAHRREKGRGRWGKERVGILRYGRREVSMKVGC